MKYWSFGLHRIADNDVKGQSVGVETVSDDHRAEKCGRLCDRNPNGCQNFELCPIVGVEGKEQCFQYQNKLLANTPTHADPHTPQCTGYYLLGNVSNYIACCTFLGI